MKALLKQKWLNLPATDKRVYTVIGIFTVSMLIYAFLWLPSVTARSKLESRIQEAKMHLAQMNMYEEQIRQLQSAIKLSHSSPAGLKQAIETSANLHQMNTYIGKLEPINNQSAVSISFPNIPFDVWIHWIAALQSEHHVRIDSCHITRLNNAVKIDAVLIAE